MRVGPEGIPEEHIIAQIEALDDSTVLRFACGMFIQLNVRIIDAQDQIPQYIGKHVIVCNVGDDQYQLHIRD